MAVLVRPDGTHQTLGHRTLVGRAPYCGVRLTEAQVSAEHASLYYDKGCWFLRDLASTNGTFVDGVRIELGRKNALTAGATIGFGAPLPVWRFLYDDPPRVRLRDSDGAVAKEPAGGLLVFPSEEQPLITLYQGPDGWIEERDGLSRKLFDQDVIECDGDRYIVEIPPPGAETAQTGLVRVGGWAGFEEIHLKFCVTRDREAIVLYVHAGNESKVVSNRAYHEMLLVLAEERIRSRDTGLSEAEQGWLFTEELCRRVAGDISKVNVDVFRARQQLEQLGVLESHRIVERKPATRQLRLGTDLVSVSLDAPHIEDAEERSPPTQPPSA